MPTHAADLLVHGANLLMLISYSVRDILWLRWFAVASAVTVIPYYLVQPTILWPPVFWSSVFLVVNVFQIARIYVERRPVVFSADEGRLYAFGFDRLRPREFIALVSAGEWKDACAGERLLTEGDPADALCIAISGAVEVAAGGKVVGTLSPGHVIGGALALTGHPSPVTATFAGDGRYIRWPLANLRSFLDRRPELRVTLQGLINRELAGKIEQFYSIAPAPP